MEEIEKRVRFVDHDCQLLVLKIDYDINIVDIDQIIIRMYDGTKFNASNCIVDTTHNFTNEYYLIDINWKMDKKFIKKIFKILDDIENLTISKIYLKMERYRIDDEKLYDILDMWRTRPFQTFLKKIKIIDLSKNQITEDVLQSLFSYIEKHIPNIEIVNLGNMIDRKNLQKILNSNLFMKHKIKTDYQL